MILYSLVIYGFINKSLGKRTDKNPLLHYFSASDYPGLLTKPFSFKNDKGVTLKGFVYYRAEHEERDEVVIFFHGFGAGHEAYTTLINDLVTKLKRPVITFDYTGCDLSEGKRIPNTLQALMDGHFFLKYLKTVPEFQNKKLILTGHSWGGFVATNLYPYNKNKNIVKVIALNSVTDFPLIYKNSAKAPAIFIPINNFLNSFRYKRFAYATTRKSIKDTPIPHLFLHGEQDESIPVTPFISSLALQSDKHGMVHFYFEADKFHNIYLTKESEQNLRQLQVDIKAYKKAKHNEDLKAKILNTNFEHLVENDEAVLNVISNFVEEKIT